MGTWRLLPQFHGVLLKAEKLRLKHMSADFSKSIIRVVKLSSLLPVVRTLVHHADAVIVISFKQCHVRTNRAHPPTMIVLQLESLGRQRRPPGIGSLMSSLGCTGGGVERLADDPLPEKTTLAAAGRLPVLHVQALSSGERGGRFAAQMALKKDQSVSN